MKIFFFNIEVVYLGLCWPPKNSPVKICQSGVFEAGLKHLSQESPLRDAHCLFIIIKVKLS